jgi:hypothetical protein
MSGRPKRHGRPPLKADRNQPPGLDRNSLKRLYFQVPSLDQGDIYKAESNGFSEMFKALTQLEPPFKFSYLQESHHENIFRKSRDGHARLVCD